jgi:hypothetical protein
MNTTPSKSYAIRCLTNDFPTLAEVEAEESRYTATGALTDAALAEMSIEDRNRYLDDAQEARDLYEIEQGYRVGTFAQWDQWISEYADKVASDRAEW